MSKRGTIRRNLEDGDRVTFVAGVHDGIGAILAERHGFDALWASGLGISTAMGFPDAGVLTMAELLQTAATIDRSSALPVICDCDTGFGDVRNVIRMVREYEAHGLAGVCVEDKPFPKRNSFRAGQELADPYEFGGRIAAAAGARRDPDFQVIARVEALIAGRDMDEALRRAELYVSAGADVILIHSKQRDAGQVLTFAERWRDLGAPAPLIAIPTTYPQVTAARLGEAGIAAVIYANQALRSGVRAMDIALARIRDEGSSAGLESHMATVREIFELTDTDQIERDEARTEAIVADLRQGRTASHAVPR